MGLFGEGITPHRDAFLTGPHHRGSARPAGSSPTSDTFSGFALGQTHALPTVTIAAAQNLSVVVTIVADPGTDYGMSNGIQIVPEPRSALLVAAGLILLAAHRRRHLGRRA